MTAGFTVVLPDDAIAARLGALPEDVRVVVWDGNGEFPASPEVRVWMPPFAETDISAIAERLPGLEVVHLPTAGADQLPDALPEGVTAHTMRGVHDRAVSEWIVAAMLAVNRDLHAYAVQQSRGRPRLRVSRPLDGSRITVLGYGSIGRSLEDRLRGFDVTLVRVARTARSGVHAVESLESLLPDTDILVVLAPLGPDTFSLVNAARLALLPDGALVINAGRGPVVDQAALHAELAAGRLRAALDLAEPDPLPDGHDLLSFENLLYTPHIAGVTNDVYSRMGAFLGDQLRRLIAGDALYNRVDTLLGDDRRGERTPA